MLPRHWLEWSGGVFPHVFLFSFRVLLMLWRRKEIK
jgi:hypothetical protein